MRSGWAVVAILMSGSVGAQVLFADDFETGTLLKTDTPAGEWDELFTNRMQWQQIGVVA